LKLRLRKLYCRLFGHRLIDMYGESVHWVEMDAFALSDCSCRVCGLTEDDGDLSECGWINDLWWRFRMGLRHALRLFCSILLLTSALSADSLVLLNGSIVKGTLIAADNRTVRFAAGNQVKNYALTEVDSIRFGAGDTAIESPAATRPTGYRPALSSPVADASPLAIPAGTAIVVRMIDAADSTKDPLGRTYRLSVDQPVFVAGRTVIPRGADATAVLVDTQQSGKFAGKTSLTLNLQSVVVNGRSYDIDSSTVTDASSSRTLRSGKVIGGTTALGAIVGALAGAGKGAAIGAASGAAVGAGAQILTSGQRVRIPSETRLTFRLDSALTL
jgi:hypothetical protein